MPGHDIIVIGTSMGGVEALTTLASQFPPNFPAAVFVVLHMSPTTPSVLWKILSRSGPLPAVQAEDRQKYENGTVYVVPPDQHMLISDGQIRLSHGPRENRCRPAIDPLFRSAALSCGPRVIGVILSGYLDDGTAGLIAVKRCGGLAVVLDPDDTLYPDMPRSALANLDVDFCVPLKEMGALLDRLAREPAVFKSNPGHPPEDITLESRIVEEGMTDQSQYDRLGEKVSLVCPECGGSLWEMKQDDMLRYRCHVGHAYSAGALLADQGIGLEQSIWAALRLMEDRCHLLQKMAREETRCGRHNSAAVYQKSYNKTKNHFETLRKLIHTQYKSVPKDNNLEKIGKDM